MSFKARRQAGGFSPFQSLASRRVPTDVSPGLFTSSSPSMASTTITTTDGFGSQTTISGELVTMVVPNIWNLPMTVTGVEAGGTTYTLKNSPQTSSASASTSSSLGSSTSNSMPTQTPASTGSPIASSSPAATSGAIVAAPSGNAEGSNGAPAPSAQTNSHSGLSGGEIAAAVVVPIVVVALAAMAAFWILRRRRRRHSLHSNPEGYAGGHATSGGASKGASNSNGAEMQDRSRGFMPPFLITKSPSKVHKNYKTGIDSSEASSVGPAMGAGQSRAAAHAYDSSSRGGASERSTDWYASSGATAQSNRSDPFTDPSSSGRSAFSGFSGAGAMASAAAPRAGAQSQSTGNQGPRAASHAGTSTRQVESVTASGAATPHVEDDAVSVISEGEYEDVEVVEVGRAHRASVINMIGSHSPPKEGSPVTEAKAQGA